ncbi:MAG: PDZ domain-containing protein [Nanoarchaeota archaeon]
MLKLTWRIWLLMILLVFSLLAIFSFPPLFLKEGVIVKSVDANSSAFISGLRQGDIITAINDKQISKFEDYAAAVDYLRNSSNISSKVVIKTNKDTLSFFTEKSLDIIVADIPKTHLKTGLDLQGGARALVKPDQNITTQQLNDLIAISSERFNVYGISDVSIRSVSDLTGTNYMLVEIAGASPKDLDNLISQQGKFEAKIGNETVFIGGNEDITYVCRNDANCATIESCQAVQTGFSCRYHFVIHLSEEAAKRHAKITGKLQANVTEGSQRYLEKQIDFFVDDKLTTSLFISEELKGRETSQIQIQGSGTGTDRDSAIKDAEASMKQMQTILLTGSLPYKLEIVKLDTISPTLGDKFIFAILLTGIVGIFLVSLIVFVRYRKIKASLALLFTSFSEILIILGFAAVINWNLDLPSIVGILVTIGTGVDMQIVILDEARSKRLLSLKEKIKGALFIVFSTFAVSFVSLIPLYWAGAGLFKGFAVTTILGITIAVLVTRPAFADMIKLIDKE